MARVFISHEHKRGEEHHLELVDRIARYLESELKDVSVPYHRRFPRIVEWIPGLLKYLLRRRIEAANLFIFVAHPNISEIIKYEVEVAKSLDKPMFAIRPKPYENASALVARYGIKCVNEDYREIRGAVLSSLRCA